MPKGLLLELYKQQDRGIFDGEYYFDSVHPSLLLTENNLLKMLKTIDLVSIATAG
jgi:hypothetical protein